MLDMAGLQKLQDAFALVQKCIYEYEGTINKFLVDDKGSTVIAAFGLPPVTHENDPVRGILASLAICAALGKLDLKASVGITTGTALCGVVGHQGNRREYTVLGDIVNLSARLMQKAKSEKGGVITDEATKLFTQDVLHFEERPEIMVKGKNDSIKIHRPYPRMSILMEFHLSRQAPITNGPGTSSSTIPRAAPMRNVMENMHRIQVRDAQRRLSTRFAQQSLSMNAAVESSCFAKIRDDLLEHCSQLNTFSPGGAFVVEGDIGVGKTFLLRTALGGPEVGSYNVVQGTACPFSSDKPYAVWAEILTKCALEQLVPSKTSSSTIDNEATSTTFGSAKRVDQMPTNSSSEMQRRRQVARFMRSKIREGATPNTTLVRYASLLNPILETNFDDFLDADDSLDSQRSRSGRSISLLGDNNRSDSTGRRSEVQRGSNQDEENQSVPEFVYPSATSPGKMLKVKEEEIAAWFLDLLEMDLAQKEDARASMMGLSPSDSKYLRTRCESEWKPADLDLSGILLLCALFAISRDKSTIFCLDNAMYMDEKSWILTAIIVKYFTNCMVVMGTRPPSLVQNENTESSSFRKQLRALKKMNSTVCHVLDPLCAQDVEALASRILEVPTIPKELADVFVSRSQGNPLFLQEIIADMRRQQAVRGWNGLLCGVKDHTNGFDKLQIRVDVKRRTCQLQVQEPWGDKSSANCCFYCHGKLSTFKDKHRCKCCGYVFCSACTPKACRRYDRVNVLWLCVHHANAVAIIHRKLPGGSGDAVRHCCSCYTISSTRRASADRSIAAAAAALSGGLGGGVPMRHKSRMRSIFQSNEPPNAYTPALKNRVALRPPRTIKSVLTTMLDQLTVSQRTLLKTASVVGAVFEEELLRNAYPIVAHLPRFEEDLDELERLGLIRRIDTFIGGVPACKSPNATTDAGAKVHPCPTNPSVKVKFEFSHGFMQDVLRSQMLCSQLDKLNGRIADVREAQQKELRHKFFAKANDSLSRPFPLTIATEELSTGRANEVGSAASSILQEVRRALTPTRRGSRSSPARERSRAAESVARSSSHSSLERTSGSTTNVLESSSQLMPIRSNSATLPAPVPIAVKAPGGAATFLRLKTGGVYVKKRSSVFAHLKFKGLTNARLWKKRFAVLQSARLLLQYDEGDGAAPSRPGASLFLKGAKVSACDPEVVSKVNCFQLEVDEWTKGKYLKTERRVFIVGVQSDEEVEDWVYMIRYAIEALETQQNDGQQLAVRGSNGIRA